MAKTKAKPKKDEIADTPLATGVFKAINVVWIGRSKQELCDSANVNIKTLDRIRTGETVTLTPGVRSICDVLGIDPEAAERGQFKPLPIEQRTIHRQLETLLKSQHGRTVRAQIEALSRLLAANDDG